MTFSLPGYDFPVHSLPFGYLNELRKGIVDFIEWCDELGVKIENTRISRYARFLKHPDANALKIFAQAFPALPATPLALQLYLVRELSDLVFIVDSLRGKKIPGLIDRLKEVVKGSDFSPLDKNSNPRNTQFELRVASYLASRRYSLDLTTETDIIAKKFAHTVHVECKRIESKKKINSNINEAVAQIFNRMPPNSKLHKHYGVVALDITQTAYGINEFSLGWDSQYSLDIARKKIFAVGASLEGNPKLNKNRILGAWLQIHNSAALVTPSMVRTVFTLNWVPTTQKGPRAVFDGFWFKRTLMSRQDKNGYASGKRRESVLFSAGGNIQIQDEESIEAVFNALPLPERSNTTKVMKVAFDNGETHQFFWYELLMLEGNLLLRYHLKKIRKRPDRFIPNLAGSLFIQRFPIHIPEDERWGAELTAT